MIRSIVFDLGGVLVSYDPLNYIRSYGFDEETAQQLLEAVYHDPLWQDLDRGTIDDYDQAVAMYQKKYPLLERQIPVLFSEGWLDRIYQPLENNVACLEKLRKQGYRVFILSNFHRRGFERIRERFSFFDLADGMVISCYPHLLKPEREIYEKLLDDYGLQADQTLFIDDGLRNVEAADKLGIRTIWYQGAADLMEQIESFTAPNMHIRQAREEDLDEIEKVYGQAIRFMRANGNMNQWINGYPSSELLVSDIRAGRLFAVLADERICGCFAFIEGVEPTYLVIEQGNWHHDEEYGTIHRMASDGTVKGFSGKCFDWCLQRKDYLRIDTHRDNLPMQKALARYGFERCGIIHLEDGSERIAFDFHK